MKACPRCGWSHAEETRQPADEGVCDLARLDSVAEAGYLVSLLEEAGIPASARPVDAFDAARGAWSLAYRVGVSVKDREAASRVLEAESHSAFAQVAEQVFDRREPAHETPRVNPWRMLTVLAFAAAAGALAMNTLGDPLRRARRAPPPERRDGRPEPLKSLVRALSAETPLHSEAGAGPGRRLSYSPAADALILATDADGDGRYESRRRFAARPIDPPPAGG